MGMDPKILLIAQIRPIKVSLDDFLEANVNEDSELSIENEWYSVVSADNGEGGVYPEEGYFAAYTSLIWGWGEVIGIHQALAEIQNFKDKIHNYCTSNNCTYKIELGVTYE